MDRLGRRVPRPPAAAGAKRVAAALGRQRSKAAAPAVPLELTGCERRGRGGAVAAAGDETELDFGAQAATTTPTASVTKTSGLTIRTPFAE